MSKDKHLEIYEATLPAELETLWQCWRQGKLASHASQLKDFAVQQRDAIRTQVGSLTVGTALLTALKLRVVELGTVHHPTEMRDQTGEIHKHLWYQGQKGEHDRHRVVQDWTTAHAGNWRRWRIEEYLFVIDRIAEELTRRLRE
jgi:hypothetical protein